MAQKTIEDYCITDIESDEISSDGRSGDFLTQLRPKIERLCKIGCEVTLTFKPCLINQYNELTLNNLCKRVLKRILGNSKAEWIFIGEHSEVGRFHFHGVIAHCPNDLMCKLRRSFARNIGLTHVKAITWCKAYEEYMLKAYYDGDDESHQNDIEQYDEAEDLIERVFSTKT